MKRISRIIMIIVLLAHFGFANAQSTPWYGYARACFNGETWQNKFISFSAEHPDEVQVASETLPEIWAATYLNGYVWFVTNTRSLCKAPFNQTTHTLAMYETVVPQLEQYNLYIDMAYNPQDGMMYYLCQDSQYNSYLKRSNLDTPTEVELVGSFNVKLWTLAINSQGQAYGVAYEGGNLYQIDLSNAATTLVGPTGKDVWYTQSMAFDMYTEELYWAQFATASDHGLFLVDTETGAATSLGDIGSGTQLTGLFMVWEIIPEPIVINEIYINGFTAPAWGEHPDYDLEVDPDEPYILSDIVWRYEYNLEDPIVSAEEYFDDETKPYYLATEFSPKPGYVFADYPHVYYDGDDSLFEIGTLFGKEYWAFSVSFHVTAPTGIVEQTEWNWAGMEGQTVKVYDMMGRLVLQERYNGTINTEGLIPGVYFINLAGRTVKIVKQ